MWARVIDVWGVAWLGSETCETKPISRRRRKKSGGDAQPAKSPSVQNEPNFWQPAGILPRIVQNEPNLARAPANGRGLAGPVSRRRANAQNEPKLARV
jgi:hypothetical protein